MEMDRKGKYCGPGHINTADEIGADKDKEEIRQWMERYIMLLEKYNSILLDRRRARRSEKVKEIAMPPLQFATVSQCGVLT